MLFKTYESKCSRDVSGFLIILFVSTAHVKVMTGRTLDIHTADICLEQPSNILGHKLQNSPRILPDLANIAKSEL